ncbi:unnamed protein product [Musa hybrid cultivar]
MTSISTAVQTTQCVCLVLRQKEPFASRNPLLPSPLSPRSRIIQESSSGFVVVVDCVILLAIVYDRLCCAQDRLHRELKFRETSSSLSFSSAFDRLDDGHDRSHRGLLSWNLLVFVTLGFDPLEDGGWDRPR